MTTKDHHLDAILMGRAVSFGPKGQPSAIAKTAVTGPVVVGKLGLAGDEQADPRHHGGLEKALHHYALDHYPVWQAEVPDISADRLTVGGFGENISTTGLGEADVCIGDIYRLGTALVQVSQGRQPCWKLNVRFGWPKMAAVVQSSGRTGWYYRVLEEGRVQAGDSLSLIERPAAEWSLAAVHRVLYVDTLNRERLQALAGCEFLTESWRSLAQKRLIRCEVEDWTPRLQTPD
ncbi:MOSC domain-containing protein [Kiloniella laminariae]|uniref:MOSC domain-containing protein n=1 Tax=Kiloniella laminariae TaxID=454162 RepID=A0ABT4LEN6_9PROT|nr:MOSC domain-containing protein [Kiloniella laminariae]MCZ4279566.1 MOSC domain-containing protein [Kiloniella laminariae]